MREHKLKFKVVEKEVIEEKKKVTCFRDLEIGELFKFETEVKEVEFSYIRLKLAKELYPQLKFGTLITMNQECFYSPDSEITPLKDIYLVHEKEKDGN